MLQTKRNWVIASLLLFIFICYVIFEMFMPYSGDDLAHMVSTSKYFETHPIWRYPFFFVGHWLDTNGRLADKINPILFITLPHWINALIAAISVPSMMWIVLKHCNFKSNHITASVVALALLVFVLPWWDSMQAFVCIYNYIIATLLPLLFLYLLQRQSNNASSHWIVRWGCYLLSLIAGMMHEAIGVPLACGLIAYQIMTNVWKELNVIQRRMVMIFMCGVAWGFFAPSLWNRLGLDTTPDDPLLLLMLKSDSLALLLLIFIAAGLCCANTRKAILKAAHTPWIIFAIAAIASMCFSAMSGIVGRSGWFAQVFAIIAIFRWITSHDYNINRITGGIISTILILAIIFHYAETARWQMKLGKEIETVAQMYGESKDGQVYFDATRDNELPWWTLNKTRGVPDADDLYLLLTFSNYYRTEKQDLLILLPTEIINIDFENLREGVKYQGTAKLSNGDIVTTDSVTRIQVLKSGREDLSVDIWIDENNVEWIVNYFNFNGTPLTHLTPRIIDPGDRLTPCVVN